MKKEAFNTQCFYFSAFSSSLTCFLTNQAITMGLIHFHKRICAFKAPWVALSYTFHYVISLSLFKLVLLLIIRDVIIPSYELGFILFFPVIAICRWMRMVEKGLQIRQACVLAKMAIIVLTLLVYILGAIYSVHTLAHVKMNDKSCMHRAPSLSILLAIQTVAWLFFINHLKISLSTYTRKS